MKKFSQKTKGYKQLCEQLKDDAMCYKQASFDDMKKSRELDKENAGLREENEKLKARIVELE